MIRRALATRNRWRTAGLLGMVALGLVIAQVVLAAPPVANFDISDTVPEMGAVSVTSTPADRRIPTTTSFCTSGTSGTAEAALPSNRVPVAYDSTAAGSRP